MNKAYRFVAIAATALIPLTACSSTDGASGGTGGASGGTDGTKKAAVLFPGLVDDQSWNQGGFQGVKKAEAEGFKVAYSEKVSQDQQVETFRNFAQAGNSVVIGHGGEYMDAALQVASEFKNVQFVVTNGTKNAANVTSMSLSYGDMGYLSGIVACSMTKTNVVGVVIGEQIPIANDAVKGWKDGCARVNPKAEVKVSVTGDFADVDKAREATIALISGGADVMGHLLDAADAGVFAAAEDKGVYAIGLYADESKLGPKAHLGAALADVGKVVHDAITKPLNDKVNVEGVKEGVVSFGAYSDAVPQSVQDEVKKAEEEIKSGKATF